MWHDLFEHAFYINMSHRTDKRDHMEAVLKRLGIANYERFEGVSKYDIEERFPPPEGVDLERVVKSYKPGAFYCNAAHYLLYKLVEERGYSSVLIFEDDAEPSDSFEEYIEQVAEELQAHNKEWHGFYFYGAREAFIKREVSDHLVLLKNFYLLPAHAYILKRACFSTGLLRCTNPYSLAPDGRRHKSVDKRLCRVLNNRAFALNNRAFPLKQRLVAQARQKFCPDNHRQMRLRENAEKEHFKDRSTGPVEGWEDN